MTKSARKGQARRDDVRITNATADLRQSESLPVQAQIVTEQAQNLSACPTNILPVQTNFLTGVTQMHRDKFLSTNSCRANHSQWK